MSGVDVRMDYGKMSAMAAAYRQASENLLDSQDQISKIHDMLDQGALIGDAAELFKEAVWYTLGEKIMNIQDKLDELADDIQNAVDKMEKGVSKAESRFA